MERTSIKNKVLPLIVASTMAMSLGVPAMAWADVEGEQPTEPIATTVPEQPGDGVVSLTEGLEPGIPAEGDLEGEGAPGAEGAADSANTALAAPAAAPLSSDDGIAP